MSTTTRAREDTIARLNDRCRMGFDRTATTMITIGVAAELDDGTPEGILAKARLLAAVRDYTFCPADGPLRDRGTLTFMGAQFTFAIDCYDPTLTAGSEDPADASITRRVMTIMLRGDL